MRNSVETELQVADEILSRACADILAIAENSTEAIRGLYHTFKARSLPISLNLLARKTGVKTQSHWSDIIRGRRTLQTKHVAAVAKVFLLDEMQTNVLALLVQLKSEKSDAVIDDVKTRLEIGRKLMAAKYRSMPMSLKPDMIAFDVFCGFGLLGQEGSEDQLAALFPDISRERLGQALELLTQLGYVQKHKDQDRYMLVRSGFVFSDSDDGLSHLEFVKGQIAEAHRKVETWFPKTQESLFQSIVLSAKKSTFLAALPKIKATLYEEAIKLDSNEGDMLLRFNVQVFPTSPL